MYVFFFVKNANLFDDASTIIGDCRIWSVIRRTMMLDAIHIIDRNDDELDDNITSICCLGVTRRKYQGDRKEVSGLGMYHNSHYHSTCS